MCVSKYWHARCMGLGSLSRQRMSTAGMGAGWGVSSFQITGSQPCVFPQAYMASSTDCSAPFSSRSKYTYVIFF